MKATFTKSDHNDCKKLTVTKFHEYHSCTFTRCGIYIEEGCTVDTFTDCKFSECTIHLNPCDGELLRKLNNTGICSDCLISVEGKKGDVYLDEDVAKEIFKGIFHSKNNSIGINDIE